MDEEMVILLAKEGHENAFHQLYENYREKIYRLTFRYTDSRQDAEDIMQETFTKAFTEINKFNYRNSSSFSSWLSRICINSTMDYLRKHKRRKMDQQVSISEIPVEPESHDMSPDESVQVEQTLHLIKGAIQELSPKQRIIFDLRHSQHRNIKEIAELLNCSESSVKTHLLRSAAKLRKYLGPILGE